MSPQDARTARFWAAVQRGDSSSCWPWLQSRTLGGYGTVILRGERTTAHRIAYRVGVGPIPAGHYVLHRCDNPACCNPGHLFTGTQRDNIADMHSKGRAGDCRTFGDDHGRTKVPDSELPRLRALRKQGFSQQRIADEFGVCQSNVSRILRGETRAGQPAA